MRNFVILIALALFAAAPAMAQGTAPKSEFFVGYEYEHLNPGGIGCHGLDVNLAYNLSDWLSAVGDFGFCRESGLPSGASAHDFDYLFGPRVTYRNYGKWNPFGQVLFGGHHLGTNGPSFNSFAMTLGGGVDYKYNDHFYVRAIQVEYLYTHLGGTRQNNARITAGLVYTF
ncbi:MAG TPA: outer membrane beta-barrel protein [Candidatus Dormibacteraeota bacterium]|nr:outer membrane beta-barrel protein [Candidatus Dormibacteraeota bacterium]